MRRRRQASSTTDYTFTGTFTSTTAAERQDALDQRFGAQRGAHRGIDVTALRRAIGTVMLHHLTVAEDRREDVVEVVRDAAGQGAHRLELLRLAQLRLEPVALRLGTLARGDVFERTGHAVRFALLVAQRDTAVAEPAPAVGAAMVDPVLDLPMRAATVEIGPQCLVHALLVVRVVAKNAPPFLAGAHRLAGFQTEEFLRAGGEEERLAAHVPVPHAFVRPGDREFVSLLRFAQCLLGAFVRIDVTDRPRPARCAAPCIMQMAATETHPAVAAIALANPAVGLLHGVALLRLTAKRLLERCLVVRMDVEQRDPLVMRAHDDRGVDAGDQQRAFRREKAIVRDVPVDDAVVGACHGARETLSPRAAPPRRLRSVMSTVEPATRSGRPSLSRKHCPRVPIQCTSPVTGSMIRYSTSSRGVSPATWSSTARWVHARSSGCIGTRARHSERCRCLSRRRRRSGGAAAATSTTRRSSRSRPSALRPRRSSRWRSAPPIDAALARTGGAPRRTRSAADGRSPVSARSCRCASCGGAGGAGRPRVRRQRDGASRRTRY